MKSLRLLALTGTTAVLMALLSDSQPRRAVATGLCGDFCKTHQCMTGCYSIDGTNYFKLTDYTCGLVDGWCTLTCNYTTPC